MNNLALQRNIAMKNGNLPLHKYLSLLLLIASLSACSALSTPAPIPTRWPTVTPFLVIELEDLVMPKHELVPEITVVLPTSPPIDVEELFPIEVQVIDCIPLMHAGWIWYEVQFNDTLDGLAQRTDTIVKKLFQINYPDEIEPLASDSLILTPENDWSWDVKPNMNSDPKYHSFLIRVWLKDRGDKGEDQWYLELESIQTGQNHRFPNLEALFDFFQEQIIKRQN